MTTNNPLSIQLTTSRDLLPSPQAKEIFKAIDKHMEAHEGENSDSHPLDDDDLSEYFDKIPEPSVGELLEAITDLEGKLNQFEEMSNMIDDLSARVSVLESLKS